MRDDIKKSSLKYIRSAYKAYLHDRNLSKNTISTMMTDSFYIWRKRGAAEFWSIVFSDDFETIGKSVLLDILHQFSKGDITNNVSGYMSNLRQFRLFLQSETVFAIPDSSVQKNKTGKITPPQMVKVLPDPSCDQVELYLDQWDSLEDYHLQEDALNRLFFKLCPKNNNISDVLLKVSALNDFYSTNIYKVFPVAKHILSLKIDSRLRRGDVTLVDDIKAVIISDKTINFYSFATKYCSHHKPLIYPIYDSYVDDVLRYYRKRDSFAKFGRDDLKNYARFRSVLEQFRSYYHLDCYNLKELDKYLWQLGKKHFNRFD
jgi:hypothetical protein